MTADVSRCFGFLTPDVTFASHFLSSLSKAIYREKETEKQNRNTKLREEEKKLPHQKKKKEKKKSGENKKAVFREKTRPDTRPIPVADGWAGEEMRVFPLFDSSVTDRPTNQPTDGRTKPLIESLVRD